VSYRRATVLAVANGRPKGIRSLDVVIEQTRIERASQLEHFDALDAKAGIVLGFAGAIVALGAAHDLIAAFGRFAAAIAGLLAIWTYVPRKLEITDVHALRRKYLGAEREFTKLVLLDTQISMFKATKYLLDVKARRLKYAMTLLAIAVVLAAWGTPIH
jgi:hypothetical protein